MNSFDKNLTPLQRQRNENHRQQIAREEARKQQQRVKRALDSWSKEKPGSQQGEQ